MCYISDTSHIKEVLNIINDSIQVPWHHITIQTSLRINLFITIDWLVG